MLQEREGLSTVEVLTHAKAAVADSKRGEHKVRAVAMMHCTTSGSGSRSVSVPLCQTRPLVKLRSE